MTSRLTVYCVGTPENVTPGPRENLRRAFVQVRGVREAVPEAYEAYGAQVAFGSGSMPYDGVAAGAGPFRGACAPGAAKDVGVGTGLGAEKPA
ncbi:hypothetical protein QFZ49_002101 [Streptomyces turgidiscabies]|uniref:Uncharacterized protein n=1 Tax=Streptomyces turgidiscabies TaxID=85558 RepID=A0ABU0RJJ8_9ACTN|nr:hypothetical protein [Streptomyces turgidiscabies]